VIRLDSRIGSGELEHLFRPYGVRVAKTKLDFGDVDFFGNGPQGLSSIVIERKVIQDLITSMYRRRLSGHQLPGMTENYDFCYLIVEGIWRPGEDGALEMFNGDGNWTRGYGRPIPYRAVDNYLATLELQGGVIYRRTATPRETVACVMDLYYYWTEKQWREHRAHAQVYVPDGYTEPTGRRLRLAPREVSLVERVAMQLPGVDTLGKDAADRFMTVEDMVRADQRDWEEVRGIGKVKAKKIVEAPRWKRQG
jgi:ERCC4-type nuclease